MGPHIQCHGAEQAQGGDAIGMRGSKALPVADTPCGNVRPFDAELLKQLENPLFKRKDHVRSHGSGSLPRWSARTKPGGHSQRWLGRARKARASPIAARLD